MRTGGRTQQGTRDWDSVFWSPVWPNTQMTGAAEQTAPREGGNNAFEPTLWVETGVEELQTVDHPDWILHGVPGGSPDMSLERGVAAHGSAVFFDYYARRESE